MIVGGTEILKVSAEPSSTVLDANLGVLRREGSTITARIAASPDMPIELEVAEDGSPTGVWRGRRLASARRPADEVDRLLDGVRVEDVGIVAIAGFGTGQHVADVARRFGDAGVVLVLETDLSLLKAVLSRIDFTGCIAPGSVRIVDQVDPATISRELAGLDALAMLGLRVLEHPASRPRLEGGGEAFAASLQEYVANARTNVATTLMRSAHTLENQLANLPAFALGSGIEDLRNAAEGRPAIVVSAGPSLRRNIELLAEEGVRDRFVIIATQTTVKPLLAAGVAPHFVTALDYHEVSRRFHEGLDPRDLEDTELVIDPKVNPAVPEAWPGRVRCIPCDPLDRILGPLARGGGPFPAGATVAHLCHQLGRHLGCDPIVLVGQDLGFTDGLYYAPGNAIHEVWTPEFNDFNTIETMEWERIVRHRGSLVEREDIHGRRIYTDGQMLSYLRIFETIFLSEQDRGLRIVDASEGGVRKAGTTCATLAEVLATEGTGNEPPLAFPRSEETSSEVSGVAARLEAVAREVAEVRRHSLEASGILKRMLDDQSDDVAMRRHFTELDGLRDAVARIAEARRLVDLVNQVAVFKRQRADRRIKLDGDLQALDRQRRELERDIVNVEWTADAADLLGDMLERTRVQMETGTRPAPKRSIADLERTAGVSAVDGSRRRIVAVVPFDPIHGGLGIERPDREDPRVLRATLERLAESEELDGIVVAIPKDWSPPAWLGDLDDGGRVVVHEVEGEIFGEAHAAVRAGRRSAATGWRGGIQGLSIYDEILCPSVARAALARMEADAAVLVGPDWPFVAVRGDWGVDAVARRFRDRPELPFVFVQAPPGIGSVLVTPGLLEVFDAHPTRRASFGHLLGYRSDRPEGDPVVGDRCVVPPAAVRDAAGRFVLDSPRAMDRHATWLTNDDATVEALVADGAVDRSVDVSRPPVELRIELGTERAAVTPRIPFLDEIDRRPMDETLFRSIVSGLGDSGDVDVVLDGVGDPLLHPDFDRFASIAIEAGAGQVRVRTDLLVEESVVDRLIAAPVDVVEIDLDADTEATWNALRGGSGWSRVCTNLERLVASRRTVAVPSGQGMHAELAPGLPWIVPRIERREETLDDIASFFERWRSRLGSAVIDGPTRWPASMGVSSDRLTPTAPPPRHDRIVARRRMTVLCDGTVPVLETDLRGEWNVGRLADRGLVECWADVVQARIEHEERTGRPPVPWRS